MICQIPHDILMTFPHPTFPPQNLHYKFSTFIKYYSANPPSERRGLLSIKPFLGYLQKFCNQNSWSHQIKFDL
jgi:hypothetical protein